MSDNIEVTINLSASDDLLTRSRVIATTALSSVFTSVPPPGTYNTVVLSIYDCLKMYENLDEVARRQSEK